MRIAKPMLLITTPIGLALGVYEAFRLAGGLAFPMIALIGVIGVAMGTVVATVRREKREDEARRALQAQATAAGTAVIEGEST
jgi:xanthosine utilization system XapX-like protein